MEKKYQVFISSTYTDLLEERKEVIQALLELDCIPVGMELFPAADEDQWSFIKTVIDDCDYYVLILAGRYGSVSDSGVGYTEMEYRYALEIGKPIISFLFEKPGELAVDRTDRDDKLEVKLNKFRKLTQNKLCKYWNTPAELGGVVGRSIVQLKKRSPAIGWVKSDLVPNKDATQKILELQNELNIAKKDLQEKQSSFAIESDGLAQGDEPHIVSYEIDVGNMFEPVVSNHELKTSWNEIFGAIAPGLMNELTDVGVKNKLNRYLKDRSLVEVGRHEGTCSISEPSYDTIIIQLRALNLIEKSTKNRGVQDSDSYWKLTQKGESSMVGLRAIRSEELTKP